MAESRFVYVTYIRAPAAKVFEALTDPEQNKLFWGGFHQQSTWAVGADFAIVGPEGDAWDTGTVLVFDPPRRLEVTWLHMHDPAMKAEGVSTCSFVLEQMGEAILEYVIQVASGEVRTAAELKNQQDFIPWRRDVSL